MGKSKRFNLVWEKSSRKKPDIWFQRLRRRITRTIGYTGQGSTNGSPNLLIIAYNL